MNGSESKINNININISAKDFIDFTTQWKGNVAETLKENIKNEDK